MKKLFSLALLLPLAVFAAVDKLQLFLPEAIYAVPGIEMNVYFDNIVRTTNSGRYVFDVDCAKGQNFTKFWRFTPKETDIGSYSWKITVFDDDGVVTTSETKVIVVPQNAGAGKKISLLMIGDSLTNGISYPPHIHKLCQMPGNPQLKMVGSYHLAGSPVKPGGPANEGYAGWKWGTFLTQWKSLPRKIGPDGKKRSDADYRMLLHYARSPFLVEKEGKLQLDFKAYLDKYNNGKAPDFITIMLGTNDVALSSDKSFAEDCATAFRNMDILLAEIRKTAKDSVIGIGFPPPPSASQDGFGSMGGCGVTRWQTKKNIHRYMLALAEKIKKNNPYNVSLIPGFINLDCENNYPVKSVNVNARSQKKVLRHIQNVHPSKEGYHQIGDAFYCWLKYQLSK